MVPHMDHPSQPGACLDEISACPDILISHEISGCELGIESPKASHRSDASTTTNQLTPGGNKRRSSFCSVGTAGSVVSIMEHRVSGEKLKPGLLSLRGLIISALVGTAVISCGSMLLIIELVADEDSDRGDQDDRVMVRRIATIVVSVVVVLASLILGFGISSSVMRPMGAVAHLVDILSSPDLAGRSRELDDLRCGSRSWIHDVGKLQDACNKLSRGVQMFTRYVPDAVVRSIVRGDENATRLHVFRRKVTIMFSDIKDFTTISESLSQEELLYVLTRYLSIMTKVVEAYQGVVAEILGDGLLVFWNTPDDVQNPEMKACAAAMVQQQVLVALNAEMERLKMPSISVRIGLHSGRVLSGTIGSETKMKFGCLGDPVNTAARLEGLCKVYGVSIICSGELYEGLPASSGFLLRELDLVQVKGRKTATRIYEVVGVENCEAYLEHKAMQSTAQRAMDRSTAALQSSDVLRVNPIRRRASFFKMGAYDLEGLAEAGTASQSFLSPNSSLGSRFSTNKLYDEVTPEALKHVELYETALHAYQRADLAEAKEPLETFLRHLPHDQAATILLDRIKRYTDPVSGEITLTDEQRAAWTGVSVLHDK